MFIKRAKRADLTEPDQRNKKVKKLDRKKEQIWQRKKERKRNRKTREILDQKINVQVDDYK